MTDDLFAVERQRSDPHNARLLARRTDPMTSKEAATAVSSTAQIGNLQRAALALVREHPGLTANDYARLFQNATDSRTIPRRLRELERKGLLRVNGSGVDPVTGKRGLLWWPSGR
jgi:predicted HTH transcriptional regulator